MAKQLQFNEEARKSLVNGVEKISKAVMTTLGPKGRLVLLDKKYGAPTVTKDGVSVAREIELEDPFENMGAQLLKEVAAKTNDVAGDGTTTATVLAWSITKEGMKSVAGCRGCCFLHQEPGKDDRGQGGDSPGRFHLRKQ